MGKFNGVWPAIRSQVNNIDYLEVVNYLREVTGDKWKCYNCIVRATCLNLCKDWNKNE